jgi:hypothetical protein
MISIYWAIGWAALAMVLGSVLGVFAIAVFASRRAARVSELEKANVRLAGDLAVTDQHKLELANDKMRLLAELAAACDQTVTLERRIKALEEERDGWHKEAVS